MTMYEMRGDRLHAQTVISRKNIFRCRNRSLAAFIVIGLPSSCWAQTPALTEQMSALPHDISPWAMFMAADMVVKTVMGCLAAASLATWTIFAAKLAQLLTSRSRTTRSLRIILNADNLEEAFKGCMTDRDPAALMLKAARDEMNISTPVVRGVGSDGVKERIASVLGRMEVDASAGLARGTGLLATIGSVSPFVGLFGTVWGIMNAFIGISKSQTTNLAVVAPGIAEALLATAIGLVAAIPAVVIYNFFARSTGAYRRMLADASAGVERLASRDLDFRAAGWASGETARHAAE